MVGGLLFGGARDERELERVGCGVMGVSVVESLVVCGSGSEGGGVGIAGGDSFGVEGFLSGERKGLWRALSRRRRLGGWGRDMIEELEKIDSE